MTDEIIEEEAAMPAEVEEKEEGTGAEEAEPTTDETNTPEEGL
jgi:hypothetical protein